MSISKSEAIKSSTISYLVAYSLEIFCTPYADDFIKRNLIYSYGLGGNQVIIFGNFSES